MRKDPSECCVCGAFQCPNSKYTTLFKENVTTDRMQASQRRYFNLADPASEKIVNATLSVSSVLLILVS